MAMFLNILQMPAGEILQEKGALKNVAKFTG